MKKIVIVVVLIILIVLLGLLGFKYKSEEAAAQKSAEARKAIDAQKAAMSEVSEAFETFGQYVSLARNDKGGRDQIVTLTDIARKKISNISDEKGIAEVKKASTLFFDSVTLFYQQKTRRGSSLVTSSADKLLSTVEKSEMSGDFKLSRVDFEAITTKIIKVYQVAYGRSQPVSSGVLVAASYQTVAPSATDSSPGQYVIPDSNVREITDSDLQGLSSFDLNIARNEIYARHGRGFVKKIYQSYFSGKSWYSEDPYYTDSRLSSLERKNAQTIIGYQKKNGLLN